MTTNGVGCLSRLASAVALAVIALLAPFAAGGCSSIEEHRKTEVILKDSKARNSTLWPVPLEAGKPETAKIDRRIAIAPVQLRGIAGPETGSPAGGGGSGPTAYAEPDDAPAARPVRVARLKPAPVGKQGVYRYRRAGDDRWVALCYREPLYRELLFAPQEGPPAPAVPEDAATGIQAPQGDSLQTATQPGDLIEYLCPRCQLSVSEKAKDCPDCGLAFADEAAPIGPRPPPDQITGVPEAGKVPPPPVAAKAIVCYFCGRDVAADVQTCPTCQVSFVFPTGEAEVGAEDIVQDRAPFPADKFQTSALVEKKDGTRCVILPSAEALQKLILQTVDGYGLFQDVQPITKSELKVQDLIDYAATGDDVGGFDYLLVPYVRQWELEYAGSSGVASTILSFAMWVAIGEPLNLVGFPTAYVAGDLFKSRVRMTFELYHVRSGKLIRKHTLRVEDAYECDQFDRGYYPYSIVALPVRNLVSDKGWQNLDKTLSALSMDKVQEQICEEVLYQNFVKVKTPPEFDAKDREQIALLVGCQAPSAQVGEAIPPLTAVSEDVKLMQNTLRQIGILDSTTSRSGSRYITFEDKNATKKNVEDFLEKQLLRFNPEDFVLIYFTGYGTSVYNPSPLAGGDRHDKYLVLYDTDPKRIRETGFDVKRISSALQRAGIRNAMVVLDTSFATPTLDETYGIGRTLPGTLQRLQPAGQPARAADPVKMDILRNTQAFPFMSFVGDLVRRGSGRRAVAIVAAEADQPAMEYGNLGDSGQGLVTHYLCEALAGGQPAGSADRDKDEKIQVSEVIEYLARHVRTVSNRDYSAPQQVRIAGKTDMAVWFIQGGLKSQRAKDMKKAEEEKARRRAAAPAPVAPAPGKK